ncbi:MAG: hypothetical protein M1828_006113 [Chrysothrix sp. TS-e1954]|nr:MAG: hypothetical protein M1828_006113 [Chrysothrix sp. TS-e1954]
MSGLQLQFPSFGKSSAADSTSATSTANNPSQANSIFSKPPTSNASTGSSLFAGLGSGSTSQAPAPSGGGLFGSNKPATTMSGPSLFGSTSNQPHAPSGSSLSGSSSQPQTTNSAPTQSTLFGSSILTNQTGQPVQQSENRNQQDGTVAQSGSGSVSAARFGDIIERGKKRRDPAGDDMNSGQLPSLQLNLGDISSKLRNLGGTRSSMKASRTEDGRAQYLLAASGVPRGATRKDLQSLASQDGEQISAPSAANDMTMDAYMANIHAKTTRELMQESLEQSKRDFDAFVEDKIQLNWDQQRRRVYEHFGLKRPEEDSDVDQDDIRGRSTRGAFGRSSRRPAKADSSLRGGTSMSFGGSGMSRSVLGGSVARGSSRANLFTDVAEKSTQGVPSGSAEDPWQRTKQEKYATKINELNRSRLQEVVYPVIEQFAHVEVESGSDTPRHLIDAYRALRHIVQEKSDVERPSEEGAVKERQYAEDYLDENTNSGKSIAMRRQILNGSRSFLEDSFYQQVEELVSKNPREANLGGVPTRINKVRAYIRIRTLRKDLGTENFELQMLGEDYCWALIFYLLRAGLVKEAAQYVAENERAIKSMDRHFAQYMASYARERDRKLPRELQARINAEYQQRSRLAPENSIDPYRMACYKVVGRCELSRKNLDGVNTGIDDLLWLYFSLAREVNRVEEAAVEAFGLEDVKAIIEEIGQRHFSPGNESGLGYATYFLMQMMGGMFEQAISWLYPHNYVAAVHFAIALDFYGLLRVSDFTVSDSELLTFTTRQKPQISFGRLLGYYTRDFRIARAEAACDYLTLICLNAQSPGSAGQSQAEVCHEALKELVLETREFALLLGDIRNDGQRIKGAIEQRLDLLSLPSTETQEQFLRSLTIQAASVADDNGRTTDAALLYHLAGDYDRVIEVINRALSESLAVEPGAEPMRLQPLKPRATGDSGAAQSQQKPPADPNSSLSLTSVDDPAILAQNMSRLYASQAMYYQKISQSNFASCDQLLRFSEVRSLISQGKWAAAFDAVNDMEIFPLKARGSISDIRSKAQAANVLTPVVARNLGNLLMWTITACGRQREKLKMNAYQNATQEGMVNELTSAAKDLMVFAGLVRYKLSPGVFDTLARAGQGSGEF